jgi:hypothetical protein
MPRLDRGIQGGRSGSPWLLDCPVKPGNDIKGEFRAFALFRQFRIFIINY